MDTHLAKLNAQGISASEVAEIMAHEYRIPLTKNAIIGRSHRIGAIRKPATNPPRSRKPRQAKITPAKSGETPVPQRQPEPHQERNASPVPLTGKHSIIPTRTFGNSTSSDCYFIEDDNLRQGANLPICGRPVIQGSPYCETHCRVTFTGTARKADREAFVPFKVF